MECTGAIRLLLQKQRVFLCILICDDALECPDRTSHFVLRAECLIVMLGQPQGAEHVI
jgi:hypothetical protein